MSFRVMNFGRNVSFVPKHRFVPRTEDELLTILNDHRDSQIRVIASRHSWSDVIKSSDVLVDMHHFDQVCIDEKDGKKWVTVGAGCQIKHLLAALNKEGLTMPSVGLITEQTIAGAISTGTHGSGNHSLSHYVTEVRVACFGSASEPAQIRTVEEGIDLQAARCALGCLGVIVSVTLPCISQYFVEERRTSYDSIQDVLTKEEHAPLQQFYLFPHRWKYYAQERVVSERQSTSFSSRLYRVYWFCCFDIGLHLLIKAFASFLRSKMLVRFLFRRIVPALIFPKWVVVDRSDRILVMEHELFRHLELEIFVPDTELVRASEYVMSILQLSDGKDVQIPEFARDKLIQAGFTHALDDLKGNFTHHYPLCFRRILCDDTLISMASGRYTSWYSISFITYVEPRDDFYAMTRFLAESMQVLFDARIHWGKWFPLGAAAVNRMYPRLPEFREVCMRFDPNGVFRNAFIAKTLGLASPENHESTT